MSGYDGRDSEGSDRLERAVFSGRSPITIVNAIGISLVYGLAAVPAFFVVLIWASLV